MPPLAINFIFGSNHMAVNIMVNLVLNIDIAFFPCSVIAQDCLLYHALFCRPKRKFYSLKRNLSCRLA